MTTEGRPLRPILIEVVMFTALCGSTFAAEGDICPVRLETRQSAKDPYELVHGNDASPLMGVTFFDGDPKDEASLAPDNETKVAATTVSTWKFVTDDKLGIFVRCSYFGTSLELQRRLVPPPGMCAVTYDDKVSTGGLPTILKITCN
jgi:hypothetical protein